MGKEKNANGEGYILDLWKKHGETRSRHTHKHYQCRIMCKELDDTGKRHFVYANDDNKETARKLCKQKAERFDSLQKQKKQSTFVASSVSLSDTFGVSALAFMDYLADQRQWAGYTRLNRIGDMRCAVRRIGGYKIKDITQETLSLLFVDLLKNYARQTVGSIHALMTDYFNYLYDTAVVASNPMLHIRLPKRNKAESLKLEQVKSGKVLKQNRQKLFNEEEISKLLYYADELSKHKELMKKGKKISKSGYNAYYVLVFAVMYLTGIRSGEMRALTFEDIDLKASTITINKALSVDETETGTTTVMKETKTANAVRTIKVSKQAVDFLNRLKEYRPNTASVFVVQNLQGDWVCKRYFPRLFDKTLKLCEIEKNGRGIHCLRHTFISFAIEQNRLSPLKNATPLFISNYVGHATLDFTEREYTKLSGNKLKDTSGVDDVDPFSVL